MTASQHMVRVNDLRLRLMADGPADGELFVLLHGFPEGAESWSRQLVALAQAGALAVAPDMRGYGLSDVPPHVEDYAIDTLVEDVAGIIRSFGRDHAHVAGHDWGALVAWSFAASHPEMTKTLTVLSVGHPAAVLEARMADDEQRKASEYIGLFVLEGKAEAVLGEDGFRRVRAMFGEALPGPAAEHFVRSLQRPGRLTAALNYYRANFLRPAAWAERAAHMSVAAPTVLVWGDRDPFLRRLQAEKTAEHVQGDYRLEVLEGAGHWLQFERPDEIARSLTGVLSK